MEICFPSSTPCKYPGLTEVGRSSDLFVFLAALRGLWDLSSLTRDQTLPSSVKVQSPNETAREFPWVGPFRAVLTVIKMALGALKDAIPVCCR